MASKPLGVNPYGLHDMAGNASEWTADWFEDSAGSNSDPVGPGSGEDRVIRGGSWASSGELYLRAAYRFYYAPGGASGSISFRCVRSN